MEAVETIKVALVDDHAILRQSLARAINEEFDLEVTGQWGSGESAVKEIKHVSVDVMIMDLKLQGIDGIEATRQIRRIKPKIKVIILSAFLDEGDLFDSIDAGVLGYLLKEATIEELLEAIRSVYRGFAVLVPEVTPKVLNKFTSLRKYIKEFEKFEFLEKKILALAADGNSNREIADALELSEGAVKFHFRELYRKLGARDRSHAVAIALKQGLIN